MSTRDLHHNIKVVQHISGAKTATVTPANGVDTLGFESVEALIHIGAIANIANSPVPSWTFHAEESDSASSGFTAITDSNRILYDASVSPVTSPDSTTGVFLTVDAANEDDATYRVGILSMKRYIRIVATAADTPGSTYILAEMILGHPALAPVDEG
ncbi:MAG: hypothetical protein VYB54_07590 [Pseudomonadota bacterium]|nr:hypothetical protein [Pseudomonadota bacterium]